MPILGQHTLAEVRDLIAAKDYEHKQIQSAADAKADSVNAKDPKWQDDWKALLDRYGSARLLALAATGLPGVRLNVTPAEPLWTKVLGSLTKDSSKPYTDQDEQGLYNRLIRIGVQPDVAHVPQPSAPDVDLGIYKSADDLTKTVDKAAEKVSPKKNPLAWILGGLALAGVGYVAIRAAVPPIPFRRRS